MIKETLDDKKSKKDIVSLISSDMYNFLVKIYNLAEDDDIKKHADILLGQLNTAGGSHIIKDEVVNFIFNNRGLVPQLSSL